MELSVVIPLFNEADNLKNLWQRLESALTAFSSYEVIFVNDGSSDATEILLQELAETNSRVNYLNLSRNFGHQIAVSAGLEYASGNYIVTLDGDLQHPPELINQLYETALQSKAQVVYACRKERIGESAIKKRFAKIYYSIFKTITGLEMLPGAADFRLLTKNALQQVLAMDEKQKFLRGQIAWLGLKPETIWYDGAARTQGKSGYSFIKMLNMGLDGITAFSNYPLRLATLAGLGISVISFLLIIQALFARFIIKDYEPGWASLMVAILFLGGVQLLSIGLIGEYIGKINDNVRKRPLYTLKSKHLKSELYAGETKQNYSA